jgi:hypothetical protein
MAKKRDAAAPAAQEETKAPETTEETIGEGTDEGTDAESGDDDPEGNEDAPEDDIQQDLADAAIDVNAVFGCDPAITGDTQDELFASLKAAALDAVAGDQKNLKPETWQYLLDNKMINHLIPAAPPAKAAATPAPAKTTATTLAQGATKAAQKPAGRDAHDLWRERE